VWGVVHPLVLLLSWTFVFQLCLRVPLQSNLTTNYTLFLFCGMLPWLLFQDTVQRSSSSLIEHANLITKTVFPAEVVPVSIFLSSLIHHVIALALAVVAVLIFAGHVSPMVVFLPAYMLLVGMLAIGLGWIVASLNVYLRDTAQVIVVALTLWFWVTPIMISEEQIPAGLRFLLKVNPLSYAVRAYRERLPVDALAEPLRVRRAGRIRSGVFRGGRAFLPALEARFRRRFVGFPALTVQPLENPFHLLLRLILSRSSSTGA